MTALPRLPSTLKRINDPTMQFHPASSWRGVLVRLLFLLPTLGMLAIAMIYLSFTGNRDVSFSVTGLAMIISYGFFTMVTAVLFVVNIVRGASRTTVIPGIGSKWYKLYTCTLCVMATAMFIFACVEQVQPPCDGFAVCNGVYALGDFSLTFNATSNDGLWNPTSGHINASYVFVSGKYTGHAQSTDELGRNFNWSLGS